MLLKKKKKNRGMPSIVRNRSIWEEYHLWLVYIYVLHFLPILHSFTGSYFSIVYSYRNSTP